MSAIVELAIVDEPNRLHDALLSHGFDVELFEWLPAEWIRLTVGDAVDVDALRSFVAAWVPPPPTPPVVVGAVEIAHALVKAVATAPDFATAQQQLVDVAAQLPQPDPTSSSSST